MNKLSKKELNKLLKCPECGRNHTDFVVSNGRFLITDGIHKYIKIIIRDLWT